MTIRLERQRRVKLIYFDYRKAICSKWLNIPIHTLLFFCGDIGKNQCDWFSLFSLFILVFILWLHDDDHKQQRFIFNRFMLIKTIQMKQRYKNELTTSHHENSISGKILLSLTWGNKVGGGFLGWWYESILCWNKILNQLWIMLWIYDF